MEKDTEVTPRRGDNLDWFFVLCWGRYDQRSLHRRNSNWIDVRERFYRHLCRRNYIADCMWNYKTVKKKNLWLVQWRQRENSLTSIMHNLLQTPLPISIFIYTPVFTGTSTVNKTVDLGVRLCFKPWVFKYLDTWL